MFGNMVSKLKEAQDLMEETKIRMESIIQKQCQKKRGKPNKGASFFI